jgi:predicted nuclease with RNAse H fold
VLWQHAGVRTLGVDLAAEPTKTATAVVAWQGGSAEVREVAVGQTDADILARTRSVDKAGIDCPLGWPEAFVEFVTAHREGRPVPSHDLAGRRSLAYRISDLDVMATIGLRPLSVATDRIGMAAIRAAGLLARLAESGEPVDRTGGGVLVGTYPAAALTCWGLTRTGYKRAANRDARERLVRSLTAALPELRLGAAAELCCADDDALDAVLCALVARAAALGLIRRPDAAQARSAAIEGWIAVPTCGLRELVA